MSKASLRRWVGVSVVVLAAVPAVASHSWGNYHWARTSNPFTLKVGDNVTSAWDGYLNNTVSDWSQSSVLDMTKVAGQAKGKNCRPTAGRVEVCNSTYGNNGWLGLAQIWLSGGHISQGVAKMNDTYFNLPQYNNADEKNHVMCQEVGHTLGLGHTSEDGSSQGTCMDYSTSPNSTSPNAHDYAQLESIYAHTDSSNSYDTSAAAAKMPPAMNDMDFNSKATWGKLVSGSKASGRSVYVADFGGGHKVVSFVYWANGSHEE